MARTAKEALIAELLGDLDGLLTRYEALASKVDAQHTQITEDVKTLDAAGERFRTAATAFADQAKQEVATYLEAKAGETREQLLQSLQAEIRQALLQALVASPVHVMDAPRGHWRRYAEIGVTAMLSSLAGAWIMAWLLH